MDYLNKAEEILNDTTWWAVSPNEKQRDKAIDLLNSAVIEFKLEKEYEKAGDTLKKIALLQYNNDYGKYNLAITYAKAGHMYEFVDMKKAMGCYLYVIPLYEDLGKVAMAVELSEKVADYYYDDGNFIEALKYYEMVNKYTNTNYNKNHCDNTYNINHCDINNTYNKNHCDTNNTYNINHCNTNNTYNINHCNVNNINLKLTLKLYDLYIRLHLFNKAVKILDVIIHYYVQMKQDPSLFLFDLGILRIYANDLSICDRYVDKYGKYNYFSTSVEYKTICNLITYVKDNDKIAFITTQNNYHNTYTLKPWHVGLLDQVHLRME